MNMTVDERAAALTGVLEHFGKLVQHAQGEDAAIGAVTVVFHESGQSSIGYVGQLDKQATIGALTDAMLSFREIVASKEVSEQMLGLLQSQTIPDSRKN